MNQRSTLAAMAATGENRKPINLIYLNSCEILVNTKYNIYATAQNALPHNVQFLKKSKIPIVRAPHN